MAKQIKLPKFFGIDIGKNTTKVAQVDRTTGKPRIIQAFSFQTGSGNLVSDDAQQRADLSVRIHDAIAGAKMQTKKCVVALPEPAVFNRLLTFPALEEQALNEAIHWNAKQFIPLPLDEVQMDWIKTAEMMVNGKEMLQLLLVAAPKKLITQTTAIFEEAGLELIAIETESVATARVIALNYPDNVPTLVLDIGSAGTDVSVLANGHLIFSQSLGTGSDAMTKAISSAFAIDVVQADQYKIKFGLVQQPGNEKIFQALEPVVNIIVSEITKTINFFRSKYQQSAPQRILILGEGGKIPGLAEHLGAKLGIQTAVASLTNAIELDKPVADQLQATGISGYAVALGLALKTE